MVEYILKGHPPRVPCRQQIKAGKHESMGISLEMTAVVSAREDWWPIGWHKMKVITLSINLMLHLMVFTDILESEHKRKTRVKDDSQMFGLSNWVSEDATYSISMVGLK